MPTAPNLDRVRQCYAVKQSNTIEPRSLASGWKSNATLPIIIGLIFFAWECLRYLYLFRQASDAKLTQWLPDDAFYYLVLSRNFVVLHKWTFDGVAPATGFHLLWGYLIALLYRAAPDISLHQIFTVLFFLAAALIAASLSLLCVMVRRLFGPYSMLGPTAIFSISLTAQLPNFLLESGLVVLFSCLAVYAVFAKDEPVTKRTLTTAFGIGVLGMLSRSDFGLLPLMLWLACLVLNRRWGGDKRVKTATSVLTGSVIGLVLVLGHTYLTAGHLAQSSAMVKHRWSSLDDPYYASHNLPHANSDRSAENAISPLT